MTVETSNLESRLEKLMAVAEVSRAIASELNLDRLLQLVADLLSKRFGYPFVHIFVVHPERRWIEFKVGRGLYADHLKSGLSCSLDNKEGLIPWVARTGQAALINNVYEDTHFAPISLPGIEIKAELTVPLVFGDEVLGVFDIESESFNAFTPDDQWLLETLAANIAIALRNAILYRSERWRRQAADSLRQVAGVVRAKETLDNTLTAILEQLATILPFTFAAIWLKSDQGYRFRIGYQTEKSSPAGQITHPWFDKIIAAQSSLIRRPGEDEPAPMAEDFPADHSAAGAVLEVDEHVWGVLVLVHYQPKRFGRETRKLIEIFASQAAIVIENTELYHRAQEEAWISTALLQVARATRNLRNLDDVLAAITRLSPMIAGVDACAIWLPDPEETETCYCAASYGFSGSEQAFLKTSTLVSSNLLVIQLGILKEPIKITPQNSAALLPSSFRALFSAQTTFFLPLLSQGELNGIMMMALSQEQVFSEERLQMLSGIAHQAASAIQTAQLIEAQQAEAYVSTALLQVAQAVVIPADLSEMFDTVTRITHMLTGVSHCLVFLYSDQERCSLAAAYGLKSLDLPLEISLTDFEALQVAITTGQPHSLDALPPLPAELAPFFKQSQFRSLILPLTVKNNIVGALMVVDDQPRPMLPGKRRDILTGIAYQIALAIDNARLYAKRARQEQLERELHLAQHIQASFIPHESPDLPGWELAAFWKMAREVGGDFFDLILRPDKRLLIIIADVADKGLPASLFMVRTSSLMRVSALEIDQPAEFLAHINRLLAQDAQKGMFVTTFCALLNVETGELSYTSAGHNPPLLVRKSGEVTTLQTAGIVLGVVETFAFEQKSLCLNEGDGILFYTDGVTEAFNDDDEMFGEERLLESIEAHWHLSGPDLVDKIYQIVSAFVHPEPQSDDFTLLLLRKRPDSE